MKKYLLIFSALFFLFNTAAYSQIITIGTGTLTQNPPFNCFNDYGRSAMIYTAAEIGNTSSSKTIYTIKFYSDLTTGFVTASTKIYFRLTTETIENPALYADKISDATLIWSGTPSWQNGWNEFALSSFTLPLGANLEVIVEVNSGSGAGHGPTSGNSIRYTNGGVQHQSWVSSGAPPTGLGTTGNNRPNVQLDFTTPPPDMIFVSQVPTGTEWFSHGITGGSAISSVNIYNSSAYPTSGVVTVHRTIKPGTYSETVSTPGIVPGNGAATINFINLPYTTGVTYTVHDTMMCAGETQILNNVANTTYTPKAAKDIGIFYTNFADADSCARHLDLTGFSSSYDLINMQGTLPSLRYWNTVFMLYGAATGWNDNSRDSMITFMNNATSINKKTICVFGADLGLIYGNTANTPDSNFYRHYLHASYLGDNWASQYPDRHFRGVGPFGAVINDTTDDNFPDKIRAQYGGRAAFMPVAAVDTTSLTGIYFGTNAYNELYVSISYSSIHSPREPPTDLMSPTPFDFMNTVVNWAQINGGMLPVELAYFNSNVLHRDATLNWSTIQEINNSGFEIERKPGNSSDWQMIASIPGHGNSTAGNNYIYIDRALSSGSYNYRLKQNDYNGNFHYYDLQNEVVIGVPLKYEMSQNYPNPFNPSTKINYHIPYESKVLIKLFDAAGREVQTVVNETQFEGYYSVNFNASSLASGVYFYQINANGTGLNSSQKFEKTMKMVLVK